MTEKNSLSTSVLPQRHRRSTALGIGVTTLITILVVMLLATFSVLSLASARADMNLTDKALQSATNYYAADAAATAWHAGLDAFLSGTTTSDWLGSLDAAGYNVSSSSGIILVRESFVVDAHRELTVMIEIATDGTPTIRQWQSVQIS